LQYSDLRLTTHISRSFRQRARFILPILRLTGLILLIVALARPQSGNAREIVSGEGVDIGIVLDISGSMAALDFEPNRLGAARQVIHEFIDNRQYDRIGLVIFATEAFSQVPPTLDYQVLKRILDETQVSWDIGLDSGTAIGLGLANGANMLRDSEVESRVIILLTDGANNSGQIDPLTAAEIAKALDIRVYTIGAARPGPAALPFPDGRIEYRDSEIDEETLQEIADITGGLPSPDTPS
jgi:Ca-activated chloride channel family protein